ncbi:hypothetical protein [Catalinimonas niigatensis]|uniref:hypothetical protein n=1 Tax=Catalinimonas niigatensis TaxID=1397264 RepID=UPI002665C0DE|nr:hypothetical protein [Catalinimonas niigatensis]WPP52349.1 hypothetical protein PZB72_08140 [Catalinimonas niigatensis]
MNSDKISVALEAYLVQVNENDLVPVLVTTQEGVDITTFEAKGLKVKRSMASIPLLSGTIKASEVKKLAAMKEVKKVELDSEITLDPP